MFGVCCCCLVVAIVVIVRKRGTDDSESEHPEALESPEAESESLSNSADDVVEVYGNIRETVTEFDAASPPEQIVYGALSDFQDRTDDEATPPLIYGALSDFQDQPDSSSGEVI